MDTVKDSRIRVPGFVEILVHCISLFT